VRPDHDAQASFSSCTPPLIVGWPSRTGHVAPGRRRPPKRAPRSGGPSGSSTSTPPGTSCAGNASPPGSRTGAAFRQCHVAHARQLRAVEHQPLRPLGQQRGPRRLQHAYPRSPRSGRSPWPHPRRPARSRCPSGCRGTGSCTEAATPPSAFPPRRPLSCASACASSASWSRTSAFRFARLIQAWLVRTPRWPSR
jgi:hypothetical protein